MLIPGVLDPQIAKEYHALEQRLLTAMTPTLSEDEFSALALEVFTFQQKWNTTLRAFFANRPKPTSWRKIPAVPQSAFKRAVLSCVPENQAQTIFHTSGTTGETRGRHFFLNPRLYDAAILGGWDMLGLPSRRTLIFASHPQDAPHSSLSHMLGVLASERAGHAQWFIDSQGKLKAEELREALRIAISEREPIALLGTALAFLNAFERIPDEQFLLPPGSFAMETGGFKGSGRELAKPDLYAMFTAHLGLAPTDIINEYGMTELSSQFYTRGLNQAHRAPPWMKALIIDPETGAEVDFDEVGIIRIIDLANLNSAIAIETQDLAIRREDGFELLGRDPAALPRGCSRAADELLRQ